MPETERPALEDADAGGSVRTRQTSGELGYSSTVNPPPTALMQGHATFGSTESTLYVLPPRVPGFPAQGGGGNVRPSASVTVLTIGLKSFWGSSQPRLNQLKCGIDAF